MVSVSLQTLSAIALCLTSSVVSAAPIDGITKRASKVIGLDFDKVLGPKNSTLLSKRGGSDNSPLINEQYYYITYLEVGSDKTKIGVDIDTGSSDLWLPGPSTDGGVTTYGTFDPDSSSSAQDVGQDFYTHYGDGSSSTGEFYKDTVSLGDGSATLKNFQFAVVEQTSVGQSGILGIGLESLEAPVYFDHRQPYTNFPFALKNAGYIDKAAYSLYLNSPTAQGGSLLFGGKDTAKIDGELVTLPHSGESDRLDITLNSVTIGGKTINVGSAFNLDSGSTITYLPSKVAFGIASKIGGDGSTDQGLPVVSCSASGTLAYNFNGISIDVPVGDIIQQGDGDSCVLNIVPSDDAILGDNFLRYAYVVYNLEDSSIGLAKPKYTSSSNIVAL